MAQNAAAEYAHMVNRYIEEGYTDGLPVIPPYPEAVEEMVAAAGRPGHEVLGVIPPRNGLATIETVAINAVMAGCRPEYMPVIVTALEAMLDPGFNLVSPACTTKGVAPLVIINGPIRHRLDINCKGNVFGPGFRANATIGRALRLILINIGGAKTQEIDKATFGHPGKYAYVIGEDEEGSHWTPFHVDHGFRAEESTVAVIASEAPRQIANFNAQAGAEGILLTLADMVSTLADFGPTGRKEAAVVLLGPEHRNTIAEEGWSKEQAQTFLYEHCRRKAGEIRRTVGNGGATWVAVDDDDEKWIRLFESPDRFKIVSAGGAAGRLSVVCNGFASEKYCKWQIRKIPES